MAWTDDFAKLIEPGSGCPLCKHVYFHQSKITKVDYLGYSWRCARKSHTSVGFRMYAYDARGNLLWKILELENEFGPVSP